MEKENRIIYVIFYTITILILTLVYISVINKPIIKKHICKIINETYYGKNGEVINKEIYENTCIKQDINVVFENIVIDPKSVKAEEPIINKTSINYKVILKKQKEFYKFDVDLINKSNVDAKINKIINNELSEELKEYLDYKITYKDGSEIKEEDILKANETKTITFLIKYKNVKVKGIINNSLDLTYELKFIEKGEE